MKLTPSEACVLYCAVLDAKPKFSKQGLASLNRALNKLWIAYPHLHDAFTKINQAHREQDQ